MLSYRERYRERYRETYRLLLSLAILTTGTSACTTVPSPSSDFLSRSDTLQVAEGLLSKRLATPPTLPIGANAKLRIAPVIFVAGATTSDEISQAERSLIKNALARNACNDFSKHFEILDAQSAATPTHQLRIGITRLEATGKLGAALGMFGSVRPPTALGGLTVEFELLSPDSKQAAAMVWARKADVMSGGTAVSTIGDAYLFAAEATSDFKDLVFKENISDRALSWINNPLAKSNAVCEVYGEGTNRTAQVLEFFGIRLPPELVDIGPAR
jgi:Protein of unknown function (DUF3313)